jgi:hypothetical protein
MKKIFYVFISLTFLLSLGGCHQDSAKKSIGGAILDLTKQDEDFVIPSSLWKTFEESYPELTVLRAPKEGEKEEDKKEEKKEEGGDGHSKKSDPRVEAEQRERDELLKHRPTIDGLSLLVSLTEKTTGLFLDGQDYNVKIGGGGGTLDFKDIYPEKKMGTFFLKVKYGSEMDPKKTKVFFLSNTPKRENVGFGSGCNRYFDITRYWNKSMKGEGITLNTVALRHLSVLTGTFFFMSPFNGKLRLGRLSIKDSRHPELICSQEQLP